jgi:hypothetical protein
LSKPALHNPYEGENSDDSFGLAGGNLLNFTCLNTTGAHPTMAHGSAFDYTNALQVRIPAPLGEIVSMAYRVPDQRLFAANFATSRHDNFNLWELLILLGVFNILN